MAKAKRLVELAAFRMKTWVQGKRTFDAIICELSINGGPRQYGQITFVVRNLRNECYSAWSDLLEKVSLRWGAASPVY